MMSALSHRVGDLQISCITIIIMIYANSNTVLLISISQHIFVLFLFLAWTTVKAE